MKRNRKCYDSFALAIQRKMLLEEEKIRIARKLHQLTDLSVKQIAEIVDLPEKKLNKVLQYQERGEAKYQLSKNETATERLFREIDNGLADMKKREEEF